MAKAIVQHLMERNVIRIYELPTLRRYIMMNPYTTKEMLEKYIRESILEHIKTEDLIVIEREYCEVDE
jgi:hypothetical protein